MKHLGVMSHWSGDVLSRFRWQFQVVEAGKTTSALPGKWEPVLRGVNETGLVWVCMCVFGVWLGLGPSFHYHLPSCPWRYNRVTINVYPPHTLPVALSLREIWISGRSEALGGRRIMATSAFQLFIISWFHTHMTHTSACECRNTRKLGRTFFPQCIENVFVFIIWFGLHFFVNVYWS